MFIYCSYASGQSVYFDTAKFHRRRIISTPNWFPRLTAIRRPLQEGEGEASGLRSHSQSSNLASNLADVAKSKPLDLVACASPSIKEIIRVFKESIASL